MKFTILTDPETGKVLYCGKGCDSMAIKELYGYCEDCWVKLSPAELAVLRGEEPPVVEIQHTERTITDTRYAEGSPLMVTLLWLWRVGISVVVVVLWRKVMGA